MSSTAQRTLVLVKPDAVRRGLVGNIVSRFEAKGLKVRSQVKAGGKFLNHSEAGVLRLPIR